MQLTAQTSTADLKSDFSEAYPYLKLEFFKKPHGANEASPKKEMYTADHLLSEVGFTGAGTTINITPEMRISEFEKQLFEGCGLCVQVFRKSGKVWLETSATDHLSLASQNELGMERNTPFTDNNPDIIDIHEQP